MLLVVSDFEIAQARRDGTLNACWGRIRRQPCKSAHSDHIPFPMSHPYAIRMPSFLQGAAKLLDLGQTLTRWDYRWVESPQEADARALASDWLAVGDDLRNAIQTYEPKQAVEK